MVQYMIVLKQEQLICVLDMFVGYQCQPILLKLLITIVNLKYN